MDGITANKLSYFRSAGGRLAARRGFSLTELAIVVSIASLVVGGIWVAASGARRHANLNQTLDEINIIAVNVRALYSGRTTVGLPAQTINNMSIYPSEMINGANVYDPWGGQVAATVVAGSPTEFNIQYHLVPTSDCVDLLPMSTTPGPDMGMKMVMINTTTLIANLPVTPSAAQAACNNPNGNIISWFYTLGS